jgi:hypothetical protein
MGDRKLDEGTKAQWRELVAEAAEREQASGQLKDACCDVCQGSGEQRLRVSGTWRRSGPPYNDPAGAHREGWRGEH